MSETQERNKHWSEVGGVGNLTFEYLSPQHKYGWHCDKCQIYMKLLPINKRPQAIHWGCRCRGIALMQRDAVFELCKQQAGKNCMTYINQL